MQKFSVGSIKLEILSGRLPCPNLPPSKSLCVCVCVGGVFNVPLSDLLWASKELQSILLLQLKLTKTCTYLFLKHQRISMPSAGAGGSWRHDVAPWSLPLWERERETLAENKRLMQNSLWFNILPLICGHKITYSTPWLCSMDHVSSEHNSPYNIMKSPVRKDSCYVQWSFLQATTVEFIIMTTSFFVKKSII